MVDISHAEESRDGQQRVGEDLLPLPAPVLRVAGVEVDQLGPAGGWREAAANGYEVEKEAPVGVDVLTILIIIVIITRCISSRNIQHRSAQL